LLIGGGSLAAVGAGAAWLGGRQMGSTADYRAATRAMRATLAAQPDVPDLVRYATLAPNGHNTQPWQFTIAPGRITLEPDFTRRTPVVDPDDHHIFVSLGCAAENLALAGAARGLDGAVAFERHGEGRLHFSYTRTAPRASPLFDAIPQRQSTRAEYDGRVVSVADLRLLADASAVPGVDVELVTDRVRLDAIRDLVVAGNSAQLADQAFMRELKTWIRFSPRRAIETGDGLYGAASGNPALPEWLGTIGFDLTFKASSDNDKYARHLRSSAGVAVFIGAVADPEHWTLVGQASQRFALQATALGMKVAFVNQPVEVAALRPELAHVVGYAGARPDLVMRFGYGPTLPYAARRPPAAVITTAAP
jgi:nitroreductase